MTHKSIGQLLVQWNKYSIIRYTIVHLLLGVLNFGTAAILFGVLQMHHQLATLIGHILHVTIGFYIDRLVSFRSPLTTTYYGVPRYWTIEVISYLSIAVTMYIMVDVYGMNPYVSRGLVATRIASMLSYGLNKIWTFNQ